MKFIFSCAFHLTKEVDFSWDVTVFLTKYLRSHIVYLIVQVIYLPQRHRGHREHNNFSQEEQKRTGVVDPVNPVHPVKNGSVPSVPLWLSSSKIC